ncbi:Flotillin-like protein [Lachnellula subtilissima]|uniref:Flotillin-like protein n=1 Tax=Lachnellula subtilissima TaxID=602034 RepID=A0A8H8RQU9_9HELO|nr:Flotillin-like protein [Lachnellula subtilissima]
MRYSIATPDTYLAITGAGIKTIRIAKSAWIYPFQKCQRFSIQPRDYPMDLQAMTREKLQFLLPVVFTVGPDCNQRGATAGQASRDGNSVEHAPEDKGDALIKYAMLLAEGNDKKNNVANSQHIDRIVKGIIEGETRVLVSSMTMEEIFTERDEFKRRIFRNIKEELAQFGLKIYNANVKELRDAPQSSYFESLSRKAAEGAINQARIDVAEAQRRGNVGEAQRHGEQNREIAKINAETAVQKTERDSERAQAEATLATRTTVFNRDVSIAQIEATRATESRDEELRKDVETKRAFTELERLRASDVVKATIARESKQQAADARQYEEKTKAQAALFAEQNAADAQAYKVRVNAEASFHAAAQEAEAQLVRQQKEAAGMSAMAGAYADLSRAFGGPAGLVQYLMIEKGVYTQLAKANADAVRGLNPKMTIWNTGAQAGGEGAHAEGTGMGGVDSIRNMYQMLPPLMSTINEQTGITLPEWQFGKLADGLSEREVSGKNVSMSNGKSHK